MIKVNIDNNRTQMGEVTIRGELSDISIELFALYSSIEEATGRNFLTRVL